MISRYNTNRKAREMDGPDLSLDNLDDEIKKIAPKFAALMEAEAEQGGGGDSDYNYFEDASATLAMIKKEQVAIDEAGEKGDPNQWRQRSQQREF